MGGNERRLWYINAQWRRIGAMGVSDDDRRLLRQMDAYGRLMKELVSMREYAVLEDLVSGTSEDRTLVGILREDAVELLLKAGALEEARAVSRLRYGEWGHLVGILIAIAGASREACDIERARSTIGRRIDISPALVRCLVEMWHAVGDPEDLHDAREVADFLPPIEKSEAYLMIGQRTRDREDFLTSIHATRAIISADAREEALKRIAKGLCSALGTSFDEWIEQQSKDAGERILH